MGLKSIVESLVFAADKPLNLQRLKELTESNDGSAIRKALQALQVEYGGRGIQLVEVAGGYQFRTNPNNSGWVRKLLAGRPPRLTRAMLETLAIVAYRQPVTRPEIEDIRGVNSGSALRALLERSLIRIVGKKEEVGRPLLYGTTRQFLEFFQLKDLKELPTLKEFTELSKEHADKVSEAYGQEALDLAEAAAQQEAGDQAAGAGAAGGDGEAGAEAAGADADKPAEVPPEAGGAEKDAGASPDSGDADQAAATSAEPPAGAPSKEGEAAPGEERAEKPAGEAAKTKPAGPTQDDGGPLRATRPEFLEDPEDVKVMASLDRALDQLKQAERAHKKAAEQRREQEQEAAAGDNSGENSAEPAGSPDSVEPGAATETKDNG